MERFDALKFSPDEAMLRGVDGNTGYELSLTLESRLTSARGRIEAWARNDSRALIYTRATKEPDQEKSKIILREAVAQISTGCNV